MSNEMIERVARALLESENGQQKDSTWTSIWGRADWRASYERAARAAIAAMREPTEAMKRVKPPTAEWDEAWDTALDVWRAMIGEALKE